MDERKYDNFSAKSKDQENIILCSTSLRYWVINSYFIWKAILIQIFWSLSKIYKSSIKY